MGRISTSRLHEHHVVEKTLEGQKAWETLAIPLHERVILNALSQPTKVGALYRQGGHHDPQVFLEQINDLAKKGWVRRAFEEKIPDSMERGERSGDGTGSSSPSLVTDAFSESSSIKPFDEAKNEEISTTTEESEMPHAVSEDSEVDAAHREWAQSLVGDADAPSVMLPASRPAWEALPASDVGPQSPTRVVPLDSDADNPTGRRESSARTAGSRSKQDEFQEQIQRLRKRQEDERRQEQMRKEENLRRQKEAAAQQEEAKALEQTRRRQREEAQRREEASTLIKMEERMRRHQKKHRS